MDEEPSGAVILAVLAALSGAVMGGTAVGIIWALGGIW